MNERSIYTKPNKANIKKPRVKVKWAWYNNETENCVIKIISWTFYKLREDEDENTKYFR